MFVIVRAIVYATLFISLVLIYIPTRLLSWTGIVRPTTLEVSQIIGMVVGAIGALITLWCLFTFVTIGKGTPAPFDLPRRLVIRGPYRFVRNPMYIGVGLTLAGAALFYESALILLYLCLFFLVTHLLVIWYEEPTLRGTFREDYEAYCRRVRRWLPGLTH